MNTPDARPSPPAPTPRHSSGRGGSGPLVSIVIPSYNKERFLAAAIDSALSQTYPSIEVVVVDDGSTDASIEVAERYADRIQLIRIENSGVSAARNAGIMAAHGDYIGLVDADDLIDQDCIEARVAILQSDPDLGVCVGAFRSVDESGATLDESDSKRATPDGDQFRHAVRMNWGVTCGALYRRRALDLCGMFDPLIRVCEDWDLLIRLSRRFRFHYDPKPRASYRMVAGSLSRGLFPLYDSAVQVMRKNAILRRGYWSYLWDSNVGLYNHCMGMIFSRAKSSGLGTSPSKAIMPLAARRPRVILFVAVWMLRAARNRVLRLFGMGAGRAVNG